MRFFKGLSLKFWFFLLGSLGIFFLSYFYTFESQELFFYDLCFRLRPPLKTHKDILLIEIDDTTLNSLGKWPLPRDYHADLLRVLKEWQVERVVFDILFSEASKEYYAADEAFSLAIKETGFVYLPLAFQLKERLPKKYLPPEASFLSAGILAPFSYNLAGSGHINSLVDRDGKIRRVPLFIRYKDEVVAHLALKLASDYLGLNLKNVEFKRGRVVIDKKMSLPVLANCAFLVNYPNTWKESFLHFSYLEIIKNYTNIKNGLKPLFAPEIFKNKICFVGLTATGTHDLRANPLEELYPMLGLQAAVASSILTQSFLKDMGRPLNTLLNLFIFWVVFFIFRGFPLFKASRQALFLAGGYFLVALGLFILWGIWLDIFLPLFIFGATYLFFSLLKFFEEYQKRQLLEKELEIAHKIQESFLPRKQKLDRVVDLSFLMQPARFVGGDLYDIIILDDTHLGIFIGDVAGKGVSASLIMAQTISFLRIFAKESLDPAVVLTRLNKELAKILEGRFITALYLIIDMHKNNFSYACAGHLAPLVYKGKSKLVEEIPLVAGPPLGILEIIEYSSSLEDFKEEDRFLLYTDGAIESRNKKGEEFGQERLKGIFLKYKDLPQDELLQRILKEITLFAKGLPQYDDISLIVFSKATSTI